MGCCDLFTCRGDTLRLIVYDDRPSHARVCTAYCVLRLFLLKMSSFKGRVATHVPECAPSEIRFVLMTEIPGKSKGKQPRRGFDPGQTVDKGGSVFGLLQLQPGSVGGPRFLLVLTWIVCFDLLFCAQKFVLWQRAPLRGWPDGRFGNTILLRAPPSATPTSTLCEPPSRMCPPVNPVWWF